jgi:hypothetical protein
VIALPDGNHVLQAGDGSKTRDSTRRLEVYSWLYKPVRPHFFLAGKDVRIDMDYYVEGFEGDSELYLVTFAGSSPRFNYRYVLPFPGNGKWAHASVCVADMKKLETKTLIPDGVPATEIKIWAYSPSPSVTLMIDNVKVIKGGTPSVASAGTVPQTSKPAPEVRHAPPPDPAKILYFDAHNQYSQKLFQRDYASAKALMEELVADPKYAPAAGLLRSDIEDLALLTEFFDRSAANAQKFVGKAIDAGGVSFKVVAVKGNEITTSVRGGQVVQPITRLKSDELMYLYNASPHTDSDKAAACRMAFYLAEGRTGDARRVLIGQLKGAVAEKYAAKLQALSEGNPAP